METAGVRQEELKKIVNRLRTEKEITLIDWFGCKSTLL